MRTRHYEIKHLSNYYTKAMPYVHRPRRTLRRLQIIPDQETRRYIDRASWIVAAISLVVVAAALVGRN